MPWPTVHLDDGLTIDLAQRSVGRDGETERLTTKEAELLAYLLERPNQTCDREELLCEVWGYRVFSETRALDATVRRLRRKLERDPANPQLLVTDYGAGYRLALASQEPATCLPPTDLYVAHPQRTEVQALLDANEARIITVTGPAGVGKTRLVRELMAPRRHAWVDLASEAEVRSAVAKQLGLVDRGDVEALVFGLSHRPLDVLVLDGVDGRQGDLTELARRLSSSIRLVLTSRGELPLVGQRVVVVRPLPQADAAELLRDRWRHRGGPVEDEAVVGELARRLDGLPLAIELAAAHARFTSMSMLLDQLRARPEAVLGRDVVDLSLEGLAPGPRRLLETLAQLPAGVSLELLSQVHGAPETLSDLGALVERSLVLTQREGDAVTYRVLEMVRAAVGGSEGITEPVAVALVDEAHRWLAASVGPDGVRAVRQLRRLAPQIARIAEDSSNPSLAARAAVVSLRLRLSEGRDPDHEAAISRVIAQLDPGPERAEVLALLAKGRQLARQSEEAARQARQAIEEVDAGGTDEERAKVRYSAADALIQGGQMAEALAALQEAIALAVDAPRIRGMALAMTGIVYGYQGAFVEAHRALEQAMVLFEDHECLRDLAYARGGRGVLWMREARWDSARRDFAFAQEVFEAMGAIDNTATARQNQALARCEEGDIEGALPQLDDALGFLQRVGDRHRANRLRLLQAAAAVCLGQTDRALDLLARTSQDAIVAAERTRIMACAHAARGERDAALRTLEDAGEMGPVERALSAVLRGETPPSSSEGTTEAERLLIAALGDATAGGTEPAGLSARLLWRAVTGVGGSD